MMRSERGDMCLPKVMGILFIGTLLNGVCGCSFTIMNNCEYTVWPGFLSNAGTEALSTTGFELAAGETRTLDTPAGWSGRLWGRTGCTFDSTGNGSCVTGDCGGSLECNGKGAVPPASLAEFTLGKGVAQDFYDVSLVDGYNLPMLVTADGGSGTCNATGCITDLNRSCPKELQVEDDGGQDSTVLACRSACEAFGNPEYCCSGEFGNPNTCKPSAYSQIFKSACPKAYSYAYDDSSSTFTCTGADYTITFCPTMASEKKSNNPPPVAHNNSTMDNNDNSQWGASAVGDTANQSQISISSSYSLSIALTIGLLSLIILTLTNASH
eukprot:Gb_25511 [translate_table: standard]